MRSNGISNSAVRLGFAGPATLFPLLFKTKLNYNTNITVTSGAASAGSYVFSANGLYDPDITSTGHQPAGFDQIMLSYEHYCGTYARIHVIAANFSGTYPTYFSIQKNAGSTPTTNYEQIIEDGTIRWACLAPKPNAGHIKKLTLDIDIAKFQGRKILVDDTDLQGSVAANPTEQSYFIIQCWNPADVTTVSINAQVSIEYFAIFSEPRRLSQSLSAPLAELIRDFERTKLVSLPDREEKIEVVDRPFMGLHDTLDPGTGARPCPRAPLARRP